MADRQGGASGMRPGAGGSNLERHIQTLVGAVILAAILWVGGTVTDNRERIATLEERIINLKETAGKIEDTLQQRAASIHNITNLDRRMDAIDRRLDHAQQRLVILEESSSPRSR